MKEKSINTEFDLSKLWIVLIALVNILLLLGYWILDNREAFLFLTKHPIVILPYLFDKLGIAKCTLFILLIVGFIPIIIALPSSNKSKKPQVIRGTKVFESDSEMKIVMKKKCIEEIKEQLKKKKVSIFKKSKIAKETYKKHFDNYMKIAGISLPHELENRGFFFFGDPGSGKTQSIKQILTTIKSREDFRGIIFDRNGEMLRTFYDPDKDLIFNPFDKRSIGWCHTSEKGVRPETIAESLIPPPLDTMGPSSHFPIAAAVVLGLIFHKTRTNQQVYRMITKSFEELQADLQNTLASAYLAEARQASSVVATANNFCKFYRYLIDTDKDQISFYNWGYQDDPRWIFVTLKENDASVLKPLHSMLFELMIKGLISNQNRKLKTAIIIDELGALNRLDSLPRLLSEGRKFLACPFLGTQTQAQITKTYRIEVTRILLQGALVKVILRCSDPETAEAMAQIIGKREILRYNTNISRTPRNLKSPATKTTTTVQNYSESFAILASEFINQDDREGYLKIGKYISPITVPYVAYPDLHEGFIDRDAELNH